MQLWIGIIKTILQMNLKTISVSEVNPFVFREEIKEAKREKTRNNHNRLFSGSDGNNAYGTSNTQWDSGPESDWSREH